MKKFLLTGVALATLVGGPALAADLPRRAPVKAPEPVVYAYNWSGLYIGAHGGGGWSEKCFTFVLGDGCHDGDGFLAGGQIGFNWQTSQFVFGVEFSGSWADISGSHTSVLFAPDTLHSEINSILMLTGRVGVAFDRMLIYVTGGGAWANEKLEYRAIGIGNSTSDKNRSGWTVGAGVEYGIAPNWSLAAQYNYIDFGDKDVAFSGGAGNFTYGVDQQVHLGTVRLNYRFGGGPVVARY